VQARDRENADAQRTKQAHPPTEATGPSDARIAAALGLQRAAGNAAVSEMLQRRAEEDVAPQAAGGAPTPGAAVRDVLRQPGRPLPSPVQQEMEARLGADFSGVRLHNDSAARESAAQVGARAFTSGSHVVLGEGGGDRHTLAHELTHVIQQRRGPVAGTPAGDGLSVSDPSDRFERAAEANADRVMAAPAPRRAEDAHAHGLHDTPHATVPVQRADADQITQVDAPAAQVDAPAATVDSESDDESLDTDAHEKLLKLATRWKTQSKFSLATGRSGELQAVDQALAAWVQGGSQTPGDIKKNKAELRVILDRIAAWRNSKDDGLSVSTRGVHIDWLERRTAALLGYSGPWQRSRNGGMAVPVDGPRHEFYAKPAIVDAANRALQAKGAPLRLEIRGRVPNELRLRGLRRVTPVMRVKDQNGTERTVRDNELLTDDQCIEVARDILGGNNVTHTVFRPAGGGPEVRHEQSPDQMTGIATYPLLLAEPGMTPADLAQRAQQRDDRFRFTWTGPAGRPVAVNDHIDGEEELAQRRVIPMLTEAGMDAGVAEALLSTITDHNLEFHPELQQRLVDRAQADGILNGNDDAEERLNTIAEGVAAPEQSTVPVAGYEGVSEREGQRRDQRFGINAYASPNVGEAFGIYSTREQTGDEREKTAKQIRKAGRGVRARHQAEEERQRAQGQTLAADELAKEKERRAEEVARAERDAEPWSYHFAGVVARDGEDMVTLENYNRRGVPNRNAMYYFALYQGGTAQSFHGEHKGTVTGALTLAMGARR
jgi:Domain of unknown function (DUF4157)